MRQAFQLLVSLFLLQLIACGGEEEIRQPDTPADDFPVGYYDTAFHTGQIGGGLYQPYFRLAAVDESGTVISDPAYNRTGILQEGDIAIRSIRWLEDYAFLDPVKDAIVLDYYNQEYLINPGLEMEHWPHFTETGDSVEYILTFVEPAKRITLPKRTLDLGLVVEWTNLDIDTLTVSYTDSLGFSIGDVWCRGERLGGHISQILKKTKTS